MVDISKDDVRLMQSQTLDDTDEGGGLMTTTEVVDGVINGLFPDISDLNRVYGNVSLRKAFLSIRTENRATYYGAHIALMEQASDPLVNMTFFTTSDWFDMRADAVDKIESYLARGPQYMAALYGNHYAGSRFLTIHTNTGLEPPSVGEVIIISLSDQSEYVRLVDVVAEEQSFQDANGSYVRQVISLEISNSLASDYTGTEVARTFNYTTVSVKIHTSVVADASEYHGIVPLAVDATTGSLQLQVESIYQAIVPSAQSTSALADFGVGTNVSAIIPITDANVSRAIAWTFSPNASIHIGEAVVPGTFSYGIYSDNGKGDIVNSSGTVIGSIDYTTGTLSLGSAAASASYSYTLAYQRAAVQPQVAYTGKIDVTTINRSFSFVFNCFPLPATKTLRVDYLSGGKWYSLYDMGNGYLAGATTDLGVGTLNSYTGTVTLSLGYLPDADSSILFFWGKTFSILELETEVIPLQLTHTLSSGQIARGSLSIAWTQGITEFSVTDDGNGNLVCNSAIVGKAKYGQGVIKFYPPCTPPPGTIFTISSQYGSKTQVTGSGLSYIIGEDVAPYSVDISTSHYVEYTGTPRSITVTSYNTYINKTSGRIIRNLRLHDDGAGNIITEDDITIGTINYTTGLVAYEFALVPIEYFQYGETTDENGLSVETANFVEYSEVGSTDGATIKFYTVESTANNVTDEVQLPKTYSINRTNAMPLLAGACTFALNGVSILDNGGGALIIPAGNSYTQVGTIDYSAKTATITSTDSRFTSLSANYALTLVSGAISAEEQTTKHLFFRTPATPLVPGSFTFKINTFSGGTVSVTANTSNEILGTGVTGDINTETGIVTLDFDDPVLVSTAVISCVVSTYMPLDADLLGLDPVRLPIDGKVPIFRDGNIILVHNTQQYTFPSSVSAGQTVNVGRTDLDYVEVYDSAGVYVPETGFYSVALATGIITMDSPLDLSAYTQPLVAVHRQEDLLLASDVQVTGHIACTSGLTHDYDASGTYVSSVLPIGNLQAKIQNMFSQEAWTDVWSDSRIGDTVLSQYNSVSYPIEVENLTSIEERWALIFQTSTTVKIVGEHSGIVATGVSILADIEYPTNGSPYFIIRKEGWGSWSAGNVLRFNTKAANFPLWFVRAVLQGPAAVSTDSYAIALRGNSS